MAVPVRGGAGITADHLVGRERESDVVHGLLTDPGGPRLVLVRGERGVGRTVFVNKVAERLRAEGVLVRAVSSVPGDGARPYLLALRLVMAVEERRPAEALRAAGRGDGTVTAALLRTALARPAPMVVVLDDIQHADPESLALLAGTDFTGVPSGVRVVASAVGRGEATTAHLSGVQGSRTIALSRLTPDETTTVVTARLGAVPDTGLVRRVRDLTRGVPGAVDSLLAEWARQGVIRVADGHAFVGVRTPTPVLRDSDRFLRALDALGEPCRTVAGALAVLWPLGVRAVPLIAGSAGLSTGQVRDTIGELVDGEIVEELPGPEGGAAQGWAFAVPLVAHALRERLGPLERSRLSATAVETLWADADADAAGIASEGKPPTTVGLDAADAVAYLADRIAEAGTLVERGRAAAELTVAAERLHPDSEGRGMLRWCRAAGHLVERPADRVPRSSAVAAANRLAVSWSSSRPTTWTGAHCPDWPRSSGGTNCRCPSWPPRPAGRWPCASWRDGARHWTC
ncbi:AAA family ATPase [Streptomyces sp. MBT65]|nr:AAA family ATPase [Streptomyces sp. MBT65]